MAKKKISYPKLVSLVQANELTNEQFKLYFMQTVNIDRGKQPDIVVNPQTVDVTGFEKAASQSAVPLIESARTEIRAPTRAAAGGDPVIVAEGDSWFRLPTILWPKTIADALAERYPVHNIAKWGDELIEDIVPSGEYRLFLGSELRFVLFSAGGNDFIGTLANFIKQRKSGDNDPNNARKYIKSNFFALIDRIQEEYSVIAQTVQSAAPQALVLIHGYDYPRPRADGPFLGRDLEFRGFNPRKAITKKLIETMVDEFNERIADLADRTANIEYVNLVGKLATRDFSDEIHPKTGAAARLSKEYDRFLQELALVA
jgi:hypothetical protein